MSQWKAGHTVALVSLLAGSVACALAGAGTVVLLQAYNPSGAMLGLTVGFIGVTVGLILCNIASAALKVADRRAAKRTRDSA